ncbi:hypothetical protein GGR52DRAFT_404892 [Hypoxylon sp. FL1284]|nr:hypothetical protein GGR52DRAFT_404892 [Hypoxylon sp. FL1284]
MANDGRNRGHLPSHDLRAKFSYSPGPDDTEEAEHAVAIPYHPAPMASGQVRLPSIQDPHGGFGPSFWDARNTGYGASPSSSNGYAPPPSGSQAPPGTGYSPPQGSGSYPPPAPYQPQVLPPGADPRAQPYFGGYGTPAPYDSHFRDQAVAAAATYPGGTYHRDVVPPSHHSAPRQRTSIACRYCRRRKIRCSGYQNNPGGKCVNCVKMNQDCVFQPVSSSASTAFVPVSAFTNGVPAGTQLFGAYGQPIPGTTSNLVPAGAYPAPGAQYEQPLPSPTGSYASEERPEASRRRPRPANDEHEMRLPPPAPYHSEDNARRRSHSSNGSPSHLQPLPQLQVQPGAYAAYDNRTPPPTSGPPAGTSSASSVMSLEHIVGGDIDQKMLGRLNRRQKK